MEKLVRDRVPYLITLHDGKSPTVRYPKDRTEAFKFLVAKLDAEVAELKEALANPNILRDAGTPEAQAAMQDAAEEAVEVMQVLVTLFPSAEITKLMREKNNEKGAFDALAIIDFPTR